MMNQSRGGNQPARTFGLLLLLCGALLGSCAHTQPKPEVLVGRSGDTAQFKRRERHLERDFFHHWVRKAYYPAAEADFDLVEGSQKTLIEQWGRPDYVRKRFIAMDGGWVDEWVYMANRRVVQFVNHETVFEGELTDLEQLLLRIGRPDEVEMTEGASGLYRITMTYHNIGLLGRQECYSLANDWIAYSYEGR